MCNPSIQQMHVVVGGLGLGPNLVFPPLQYTYLVWKVNLPCHWRFVRWATFDQLNKQDFLIYECQELLLALSCEKKPRVVLMKWGKI